MFRFSKMYFFFKEMYTCVQQVCIKLIKSDSKDIDNVAVLLFFSIHQRILKTAFHRYIKKKLIRTVS